MVKDVKERSVIVQDANKEIREIPYGLLVWATGNTSRDITRNLMGKLPQAQTQRRGIVVDDYMSMIGADGIYALGDCTATSYAPTAQVASQQGMYLAQMFGKLGQKAKLERELAEHRATGADAQQIESLAKKLTRAAKLTPFHYSHQVRNTYSSAARGSLTNRDLLPISDQKRPSPIFLSSMVMSRREELLPCGSGVQPMLYVLAVAAYRISANFQSTLYSVRNRTLVLTDWIKVKLFGR